MLPPEKNLEVRSQRPARSNGKPPLLFVHGGYCDAWCWDRYFLPWFAAQGYAAHALSLRGHGASGGRETLFVAGIEDYAADVERVAATLPLAPVLIGHSMGASVVEHLLVNRSVRAAALLAPVPPAGLGPIAGRLLALQPEYLVHLHRLDAPHLAGDVLAALRPLYFSDDVAPDVLAEAMFHITAESPRAILDLTLRWHSSRAGVEITPFVLAAAGDRVSTVADARATAELYGTEAMVVPRLAHMMMLERRWETAAKLLLQWLERDVRSSPR